MAIMLPDDPTYYYSGSKGETNVFNSLEKHLDNDWLVIHSFRWLKLDALSGRKAQGEGDFVLFHKEFGVLVIEVKGGDIECSNGKWSSTDHRGVKNTIQDPEKQASDTKFQIIDRMKKGQIKHVPVYHVVWFPDVRCDDVQLPANYNEQIVFDEKTLLEPGSAIIGAFEFWTKTTGYHAHGLSQEICDKVSSMLRPQMRLARSLKRISSDLNDTYIRLTNEQMTLFENLELVKELSIIGRAGTGKTIVATEKARKEAELGKSVLQLCYNTELAKKIKEIQNPSVRVNTIHSFALEYMKSAYPARVQGEFVTDEDFDFLLSEFMDVASKTTLLYDAIIIDEGQDFQPNWVQAITSFRAKSSSIFVFYDPYQQLYSSDSLMNDDYLKLSVPYVLKRNMRNTDEISAASLNIINLPHTKDYFNGIRGKELKVVFVQEVSDYNNLVSSEIHGLLFRENLDEQDITVLTLSGIVGSKITNDDTKGAIFTTVRKYKGLENEVIVIVDADLSNLIDPVKQRSLYTAISRAKTHVVLFFEIDKRFMNLAMAQLKCAEEQLPATIEKYIKKGEFHGEHVQ